MNQFDEKICSGGKFPKLPHCEYVSYIFFHSMLNFLNLANFSPQKVHKIKISQNAEFPNGYAKMANFETLNLPTLISRKI